MHRRQQQQQQTPTTSLTNLDKASADSGPLQCPLVDVINVVDDEPAPRQEVELFAQQLLQARNVAPSSTLPRDQPARADELPSYHAKMPEQQQVVDQQGNQLDGGDQASQPQFPKEKQEALEEKRICNAKLKRLLSEMHHGGPRQLLAPTYREGLQLIMDSQMPFEQVDLDCIFGDSL